MQSQLGALRRTLHPDLALGVLVAGIVAMMVVPLPTGLLDVLIASNLALSVLLLLVALSVRDGLAFSAMPTLLLMTTLYRLALNVSSTRLILLQADAGKIIAAFGDFVVRGDYAVGAAVFLVLTIVQYVVVARGAERVAEVGARFSLDALPGKQMAIDADVRSGALSGAQARERRRTLEQESRFYGAMDGAMKFVKGDAIAGIAIALVSFIAGSAIGALRDGLPLAHSLQRYGLLTIGDALVSQIPSLLVATSAGLVVTRVASGEEDGSLGRDLGRQLLGNARVVWTGAALFGALMLIPGLPAAPFATLAGVLALIGLQAHASAQHIPSAAQTAAPIVRATDLGLDAVQALLDNEAKHTPVLVQHVVPQTLTLRTLTTVLQRLLVEGVSIQPLRPVLEAIVAEGESGQAEPGTSRALVERVRARLSRRITEACSERGTLFAHAIDPMIEDAVRDAVQGSGDSAYLALAPDLASDIIASIRRTVDRRAEKAVLLTQPDVRRWLRSLIEHELPDVAVLSYAELAPDAIVERRALVTHR